jgi:hypothetical protein
MRLEAGHVGRIGRQTAAGGNDGLAARAEGIDHVSFIFAKGGLALLGEDFGIDFPTSFSINSSVSIKAKWRCSAARRPTEDLPVPIKPIRARFWMSRTSLIVQEG